MDCQHFEIAYSCTDFHDAETGYSDYAETWTCRGCGETWTEDDMNGRAA